MEKNVSSVDLEELLKAREDLDRERGVETDPNLYRDYNPNRESESENNTEVTLENDNNYETITNTQSPTPIDDSLENVTNENDVNVEQENENTQSFNSYEESNVDSQTSSDNIGSSESNLSKFDIFSAFELKENAPINEEKREESSIQHHESSRSEITLENAMTETEIDSRLEDIDSADELEDLLSQLLDELEEDDEIEPEKKEENKEINILETLSVASEDDDTTENVVEESKEVSSLPSIDVEPKIDSDISDIQKDLNGKEQISKTDSNPLIDLELDDLLEPLSEEELMDDDEIERELDEIIAQLEKEEKLERDGLVSNETLNSDSGSSEVERVIEELINVLTETSSQLDELEDDAKIEPEFKDAVLETPKVDVDVEKKLNEDSEVKIEELEDNSEDTEESADSEEELEEIADEEELEESPEELNEEDVSDEPSEEIKKEEVIEEPDINSIFRKNRVPEPVVEYSRPQPTYTENTRSTDDVEVITDYSQLRDILQKQLKEAEEIDAEEFKKKHTFKEIEDFKFIDEIASDEFKDADKFSYILGKNEKNEMIYGNFREHCNLGVFGRNDNAVNSLLNSMILSLCLKNSFHDVNFVLLDSDINSPFEVYNKSSYLYFNRIAKTNKEILDTLIEVSKEVDNRYNKFAALGVKNIESYNEIASENSMQIMPTVILVFNNYTSASQATDHDRINACLYQILKYGRIAGIYAVVTAKLPIEVNQVNYSLSSRISLKSDETSRFTVGVEDVEYLPSENDAMYYNIASNRTEHIKIATVTEMELDLIIKDLEE